MSRAIWRYGVAIVSVVVALLITLALQSYTDITPLFYAAIVVSAWYGGRGPGLVSVILATVALDYYFIPPLYTLSPSLKQASFLVGFGLLAIVTSWMSSKRKQAEEVMREARDELELRVQERTEELRQANETLRERSEALQETQTELAHVTRVMTLGELTASIAHEVNQPLAAIVTNGNATLRWLAQPNLGEARQAVHRIIKDSYRASEVIARVRTLVRKAPPRHDWIDLNEIILEVFALAENEARRNRVALKQDLPDDLPRVLGDRVQLQQVILNLVMNGMESIVKHNDGLRELSVASSTHEADTVHVAVRDTGAGLDSASLDRLFDAFFSTKPGGMGMGLAISRTIIESHGGRLWATANSPQGAVFQFSLPLEDKKDNE